MLQWSVRALAEKAGVRPATISNFETEKRSPNRATKAAIQRAFEAAGVEFTNGAKPGVRLAAAELKAEASKKKGGDQPA